MTNIPTKAIFQVMSKIHYIYEAKEDYAQALDTLKMLLKIINEK